MVVMEMAEGAVGRSSSLECERGEAEAEAWGRRWMKQDHYMSASVLYRQLLQESLWRVQPVSNGTWSPISGGNDLELCLGTVRA